MPNLRWKIAGILYLMIFASAETINGSHKHPAPTSSSLAIFRGKGETCADCSSFKMHVAVGNFLYLWLSDLFSRQPHQPCQLLVWSDFDLCVGTVSPRRGYRWAISCPDCYYCSVYFSPLKGAMGLLKSPEFSRVMVCFNYMFVPHGLRLGQNFLNLSQKQLASTV